MFNALTSLYKAPAVFCVALYTLARPVKLSSFLYNVFAAPVTFSKGFKKLPTDLNKFLDWLISFNPFRVLLIALPASAAISTALRPLLIIGTFLRLFAVAANKLPPPVNGANKPPATSSSIALDIIPAV